MNFLRHVRLRLLFGGALSLACLWLALRPVRFDELGHALASANPFWLIPAAGLQLLAVFARTRRWIVLLRFQARFSDAFWSQGIGYLFTNVLPLRMGEPARVLVMARQSRLPVTQVATTAIIERLLDVATILVVLVVVLPFMQVPTLVAQAGTSFAAVTLAALGALFVLSRSNIPLERGLMKFAARSKLLSAEQVHARWHELILGLGLMRSRRTTGEAVVWSAATWSFSIGTYWCVLRAFASGGLFVEAAFMLVSLSLASSVPSSPGFIGVFQLVGEQALVIPFGFKYDLATALAITFTAHITYYLLTTALGLGGLLVLGESLARLRRVVAPETADGLHDLAV